MTLSATIFLAVVLVLRLTPVLAAPTLTVNGSSTPISVTSGSKKTVSVGFQNAPGNRWDWIGLYKTSTNTLLNGFYLNGLHAPPSRGVTSGTVTFTLPTSPGTYGFRLLSNNGFATLATSPTVTVQGVVAPTLTVNGGSTGITVSGGTTVTVGVQHGPGTGSDCVGLYPINAGPLAPALSVVSVRGSTATVSFVVPSTPGPYEFRFFQNCANARRLATSPRVTVPGILRLTVNGGSTGITVSGGTTVTVGVQNGPGTAGDCVGLYPKSAALLDPALRLAAVPASSATVSFVLPTTAGAYEFRFFQNCANARRLATSPTVIVQSAGSRLTVNGNTTPITVSAGATVTVGVQSGPGTAGDCVGLYPTSATLFDAALRFASIPGSTATVSFVLPSTPGTYEFRFFQNCANARRLATSPTITSTPPPPSVAHLPELPRVFVDTTMPTTTTTVTVCARGCDYPNDQLQLAIDHAQPGTTITLEPGVTYTGPNDTGFILKNKPTGSGWITIQTAAISSLPPPGTRLTPAYSAFMPKLLRRYLYAMSCEASAHHYRIIGVEFMNPGNVDTQFPGAAFVPCGNNETSLNTQPHHILFDRVYVHGPSAGGSLGVKFGIVLMGAHQGVIDSTVEDITYGTDAQAIGGWAGAGPFVIKNNALSSSGENIAFGGGDTTIPNLIPSDIEIRHNYIYKPLKWRDDPAYNSGRNRIIVKNLFELKNAQRVLIDGNVFENMWPGAQVGFALTFTPRQGGDSGQQPWTLVQDITVTNNIFKSTANGIGISGRDANPALPTSPGGRYLIRNNLFVNSGGYSGTGIMIQVGNGAFDVTIQHNTVASYAPNSSGGISLRFLNGTSATGDLTPMERFVLRDNIFQAREYPFFVQGGSCYASSLSEGLPGFVWTNTIIAGPWPTSAGCQSIFSPQGDGNAYPFSVSDIGFVNMAGGDFRLSAISPYKNAGSDGKDIGVVWNEFELAQHPLP